MNSTLVDHTYGNQLITLDQLRMVQTPVGTRTHRPVPHHEVVEALIETLGFRHIGVVGEKFVVSPDGAKMFGTLDLAAEMDDARFAIGIRNAHDKSMRLAITCGFTVFVCTNMAFSGDFTPVLAKHSMSLNIRDSLAVGVDRMQRNFDGMRKQVDTWKATQITDVAAKLLIYEAFIESKLDAPKHLGRKVHDLYFNPIYPEFQGRTMWSLQNAFTSAFKELDPIPLFKATTDLAGFIENRPSHLLESPSPVEIPVLEAELLS